MIIYPAHGVYLGNSSLAELVQKPINVIFRINKTKPMIISTDAEQIFNKT